jgi:hypothetical protein
LPGSSEDTLAKRTLSRLGLYEDIAADKEFEKWRAKQRRVNVDDRVFYLAGGDRLLDESELMLNWAVERGRADTALVSAAQRELMKQVPPDDVDFIDLDEEQGGKT